MKRIVIRTLGGRKIGYGHFYRCLSLAKAIRLLDKDIDITFIINEELENLIANTGFKFIISSDLKKDYKIMDKLNINLFIFDSYLGNNEYLINVKEKTKLMLIDDNNDIYDSSIPDIIYNGNIHAESLGYSDIEGQLKLLGPKYLVMKEEYWDNNTDLNSNKDGILITTGGTDEYGITLKILEEIKDLDIKIKIIIGPGYTYDYIKKIEEIKMENVELIYKPNSLKRYIASSKLVITAGGSTVYEVLSQRSIPIIFSIADNQDLICKELSDIGIEYLGKYPDINYNMIINNIKRSNIRIYSKDEMFSLIKGDGAKVTAEILM
ncbi:hypothetical protein [uncultured Tissierella sp.]|uniref:hypothetical protein n=1 Tax=uncultured Tissierella sp. TaxID=448160 RepID=UPI0028061B9B|nr:hypothetical protein [uncultured Tissierella sp.]MDU5079760.1 hypothetical protein [Bacillota bacterium]